MRLTVQQTLRRLKKAGIVKGTGRGKKIDVPLKKLQRCMKDEWESAVMVARYEGGER
jgi:hypothetical protein